MRFAIPALFAFSTPAFADASENLLEERRGQSAMDKLRGSIGSASMESDPPPVRQ